MTSAPGQPLDDYLPQPGTDLYYAHLYAPAPLRPTLALIEALRGEIARVPASCSNADIAATKLAWWREEIARLDAGQPRHALCIALLPQRATLPALPAAAHALIDGVGALLDITRHPTRAARSAAFDAAHGPLWELVNALTTPLAPDAARAARQLGSRIEEAYALRDTRRFVGSGAALLAQETVQFIEVQLAGATLSDAQWYARVIAHDIDQCLLALDAQLAALPARRRLRPLATLARLARATLIEVRDDGCQVWEQRVELTPLRKLLIALRERAGL